MDVVLSPVAGDATVAEASEGVLFGTSTVGVTPVAPVEGEFNYGPQETLQSLEPPDKSLQVPEIPELSAPPGRHFPSPPPGGYTLCKSHAYTRGYVYSADYDLSTMQEHRHRLINISTPPLAELDGQLIVPSMIRMVPGVPFVFRFNGDPSRTHTVGCLQTLESLKHYPDYDLILDASVQLARLSWGTPPGDHANIPPVYELDGLKVNDRSAKRPFLNNTRDGSYSLGHTVMKGDGLGTVLPSVQADSSQAVQQIGAILKVLHTLRRLVMPKCLSKFEHDIWDFHMDMNNVFSFGGLAPNGSSVQLNVSSLGINLPSAIGDQQGFWHADFCDDAQFWTLFILMLRLGPDGDPGPFFLARGGVYVHELGAWIVFLVFKGTDLHTGVAPHEDTEKHKEWVKSSLDAMWNLAGPQNRLGYVIYLGAVPSKRLGSTNVTPPTGFGNYGSNASHKAMQKDFATHGHTTMGSLDDRANRLGREAVSNFHNMLLLSKLRLNIDIDTLVQNISYLDSSGCHLALQPLPYHPVRDKHLIHHYRSLYSWHSSESNLFNLGITNKMLQSAAPVSSSESMSEPVEDAVDLEPSDDCLYLPIDEVLGKGFVSGRAVFTVRLSDDHTIYNIRRDHPCARRNDRIRSWLMLRLGLTGPTGLPNNPGASALLGSDDVVTLSNLFALPSPTLDPLLTRGSRLTMADSSALSSTRPDLLSTSPSPSMSDSPYMPSSLNSQGLQLLSNPPDLLLNLRDLSLSDSPLGSSIPNNRTSVSESLETSTSSSLYLSPAHSQEPSTPNSQLGDPSTPISQIEELSTPTSGSQVLIMDSQHSSLSCSPPPSLISPENSQGPLPTHSREPSIPTPPASMSNSHAMSRPSSVFSSPTLSSGEPSGPNAQVSSLDSQDSRSLRSSRKAHTISPVNPDSGGESEVASAAQVAGKAAKTKTRKTRNKRKRQPSCDRNSDADTNPDVDSDVYVVEAVVDHNFDNPEKRLWKVKWEGHDEETWVDENGLFGCMRLLCEYNGKHGLDNSHLPHTVLPKPTGKMPVQARTNVVGELAANMNQILHLLEERRLDNEVAALVFQFQTAINGGKEYWSAGLSISSLAALWADHRGASHDLSACLPFFESEPVNSAYIKFQLVQKSISVLPIMGAHLHQVDLISRGFQQEMCRALVAVYDWYANTGPLLSQLLLSCYQSSGFAGLMQKSPQFARLVDHVVQYVYHHVKTMLSEPLKKDAKRPRLGEKHELIVEFNALPRTHFSNHFVSISSEDLHFIPGDLYGLIPSPKSASRLKLPRVNRGRLPVATNPVAALFTASSICIEEFWSRELILPSIKILESHSTVFLRSSPSDVDVLRDRVVTRGAILSCLEHACQSDGIFASDAMKLLLLRPIQDLFPSESRTSTCAAKLLGPNRSTLLEPLRERIEEHLEQYPGVLGKATRLGELVEAHLSAIHSGGEVDYHDFIEAVEEDDGEGMEDTTTSAKKRSRKKPSALSVELTSKAKEALLQQGLPTPFLAPLALILREALNRKRHLPVGNETMGRILIGRHPNQSSTRMYPSNHTDPIRQFSDYALLFSRHLPGRKLTLRSGISTLLSWMGTGQGCGTRAFLTGITRPDGFFSLTLDHQLEVFQPVLSGNQSLSLQLRSAGTVKMHNIVGYVACFDERIWGQPNNLFNVQPVVPRSKAKSKPQSRVSSSYKPRMTIEEKFSPYWTSSTQDQWCDLLAEMEGKDPDTWSGPRPSWLSVMAFLQGLGIPLFGRGLTVLQTANNLVFANIATMPTEAEVSAWIFKNKTLGAYRGLQMLGFQFLNSPASVQFAFTAIYQHLDNFLSDEDKRDLGFNTLFLEHVLCKVARWSSRLQSSKSHGTVPTLHDLSARLEKEVPEWVVRSNLTDHFAIPFPLYISEQTLISVRSSTVG